MSLPSPLLKIKLII